MVSTTPPALYKVLYKQGSYCFEWLIFSLIFLTFILFLLLFDHGIVSFLGAKIYYLMNIDASETWKDFWITQSKKKNNGSHIAINNFMCCFSENNSWQTDERNISYCLFSQLYHSNLMSYPFSSFFDFAWNRIVLF